VHGEDKPSFVSVIYTEIERVKSTSKRAQHTEEQKRRMYKYCGGKHEAIRTKCPAYGKICRRCKKVNHFHAVCLKGRYIGKQQNPIASIKEAEQSSSSESEELVYDLEHVGTIRHTEKGQYFVPLSLNTNQAHNSRLSIRHWGNLQCNEFKGHLYNPAYKNTTVAARNNTAEVL